ncbi:N-acetylglucosamine-6-phosphate deacetylase [Clostridium sp. MCC353]|uniref:N-acetylglucosamine-6-phosphate deacetylase n=1 Tax=Clostridium sp. MCC353 TaxID=2592646 RepID=UPI001C021352|nr:N-acetylglucosamine-6-phosphate deacetylase [Clostridium sp. MCC353]MBT9776023.1 N-acetylglucosamine-6-phosphate deacetylase [Clostridium sp. MCC353]
MKTLLKNGLLYLNHGFEKKDLLLRDGIISQIGESLEDGEAEVTDLEGKKVAPGFFDIHTHGAVNVDVNAASAEDFEAICRFFASKGVTSWLCSILTDTREQTLACIEEYKRWKTLEHKGADLAGIHLEGPFLCAEYKGAMPEHLLRPADLELLKEYQEAAGGDIRYITVSPEVEGIVDMIPEIKKLGIQTAIGHSGADYDTARAAIKNGAAASTHTGNAMKLLHQHFPAIWGAVLEDDDLYCEMICDGRHLHPGTVRLIIKTKGLDRVIAVTDSIMASGLPDGKYKLGVNDVVVVDGDAKLAVGGSRAGSTLTMDAALRNLLEFTGRPIEELIPVMTENPARLMGMYGSIGSIDTGKDGDLVVLDEENRVFSTYSKGKMQYHV